ncbi:hypothetical protein IE81DRAFT_321272 [Ceraceosorus guamensis]|uniref:Uncharacterized protein n=1 Tax=Ceraceosorus guamensis TaxID=1522189 RepID=A0A316W3U3_9BASI|nr:hypothetical protein IE81DRAFT_321272 [Ceraceosorus guamensis]PWN44379.1 hypothetical protein IE81DRAFT_321272 [Ceraceosorus guamensis]
MHAVANASIPSRAPWMCSDTSGASSSNVGLAMLGRNAHPSLPRRPPPPPPAPQHQHHDAQRDSATMQAGSLVLGRSHLHQGHPGGGSPRSAQHALPAKPNVSSTSGADRAARKRPRVSSDATTLRPVVHSRSQSHDNKRAKKHSSPLSDSCTSEQSSTNAAQRAGHRPTRSIDASASPSSNHQPLSPTFTALTPTWAIEKTTKMLNVLASLDSSRRWIFDTARERLGAALRQCASGLNPEPCVESLIGQAIVACFELAGERWVEYSSGSGPLDGELHVCADEEAYKEAQARFLNGRLARDLCGAAFEHRVDVTAELSASDVRLASIQEALAETRKWIKERLDSAKDKYVLESRLVLQRRSH